MRIAEKAFIYLIEDKNIPRAGSTLQICLSSLKDPIKLFLIKYFALISFIGGESVRDGGEGSTAEGVLLLLLLLSSFTARLQEQSALWRTPLCASSTPSTMNRTLYLLIDTSTAAHNIFDLSFYRLRASQSLSYFKAHGLETYPNFLY